MPYPGFDAPVEVARYRLRDRDGSMVDLTPGVAADAPEFICSHGELLGEGACGFVSALVLESDVTAMVIKEGCLFEGGMERTAEEIADRQVVFQKEARYIRQLYGEPASVIFFDMTDPDSGEATPCFRILMRQVPGVKLADALGAAENDMERLSIIRQSFLASQQLNEEEHIAHDDLTVGNVMIERVAEEGGARFIARIIDFGESGEFDPASDDSDTDHLLDTLARVIDELEGSELTRAFIESLDGMTVVEKLAQVDERLTAAADSHLKANQQAVFLKLRAAGVLEVLVEMTEPTTIQEQLMAHAAELFPADAVSMLGGETLLEFKAYCVESQRASNARAASGLFAAADLASSAPARAAEEAKQAEGKTMDEGEGKEAEVSRPETP